MISESRLVGAVLSPEASLSEFRMRGLIPRSSRAPRVICSYLSVVRSLGRTAPSPNPSRKGLILIHMESLILLPTNSI